MAPEEEEKDVPVQVDQPEVQPADGEEQVAPALSEEEPAEVWVKPILYAALLEKKK